MIELYDIWQNVSSKKNGRQRLPSECHFDLQWRNINRVDYLANLAFMA